MRRIFNSLFDIWISRWNTLSRVWYISSPIFGEEKNCQKFLIFQILAVVAPDQHVWTKTLLIKIYVKRSGISILFDLTREFSRYLFTKITPVISMDSLHKYISRYFITLKLLYFTFSITCIESLSSFLI